MKILFITSSFYPSVGGVEKHCAEIGERLVNKGHSVSVITEYNDKLQANYQILDRSDTKSIRSKKVFKSDYFASFRYKKMQVFAFRFGKKNWKKKFRIWTNLIKNKEIFYEVDIIHCHDVFIWYLPLRFLFFRKKVFTTFHGYESYPISTRAIILRKISEILSRGNICVGDFMKKWYFTNSDYVIYGGVNVPKKQIFPTSNSALFFGRLDEQTGILDYVKAIEIIRKKTLSFNFEVIGDGKYRNKIKYKIKEFDPEVEKKIPNFRFIFVSRYLSILEALAAKRMVFALYDNPVKEDYLRMPPFSKFISISKTPKELADSVLFYLNNPKQEKENLTKGYEWAKKQSWENVVSVYEKLWNKN